MPVGAGAGLILALFPSPEWLPSHALSSEGRVKHWLSACMKTRLGRRFLSRSENFLGAAGARDTNLMAWLMT